MKTSARPYPADLIPSGGIDRRLWTADELHTMRDIGIFGETEKIELIAGEILVNTDVMPERDFAPSERVLDRTNGLPLDGVLRRLWTADELERILDAGILHEDDGLELIGGDVVIMPPKGNRHERLRNELIIYWARRLPADIRFAEEAPLKLGPQDEPQPDIILFPDDLPVTSVSGGTVLLVVEISDSSLSKDMTIKAPIYASFGVRDYWVIDAKALTTIVHRNPEGGQYQQKTKVARSALLTPALVPALSVRLADLGIR